MRMLLLTIIIVSLGLLESLASSNSAVYTENLDILQTERWSVLSFSHKTTLNKLGYKNARNSHTDIFPRSIADLYFHFDIKEIHLTFTQGRLPRNLPIGHSAPTVVQVVAWVGNTDTSALTKSLSGLFCASLNFLDSTKTAIPNHTFEPLGSFKNDSLFYGALPKEVTCTENLTPWAKLLPCRAQSGIASLYNGYKLFDSNFHSMSLHIVPTCKDTELECELTLEQKLVVAVDSKRLLGTSDYSLSKHLDRKIAGSCPVAESTRINLTSNGGEYTYLTPPDQMEGKSAVYTNITDQMDIGLVYSESPVVMKQDFTVHRYLGGFGSERGKVKLVLNNEKDTTLKVTVFQMIPWYLKFYLHTLQSSCPITSRRYQASIDRVRPTTLELDLELPPGKTLLSIDFDKQFIRYTEHPPDANRGFDMAGAAVRLTNSGELVYSENLIIYLPTPDFSMPYNVITLTCTVLALAFGSVFNLSIREYRPI